MGTDHNVDHQVKGGDGSKSNPFAIDAFNGFSSATAQKRVISKVYGEGRWKVANRNYYESPNGKPDNKDLCEWVIEVGGMNVSVWFDLYIVTLYGTDPKWIAQKQKIVGPPNQKVMDAIKTEFANRVQIVVDKSPSDLEPVEEVRCLNGARALDSKPPVSPIQEQTSVFKEYGVSLRNPIVVNGIIGLAIYLKTLRFKHSTKPTKGTLEYSIMHGDYPVDCLRVADGAHEQHLFFCVYGRRCDTIYPVGFYRQPFEGDFDFELSDFIGASQLVELRGNSEIPTKLGACVFANNPELSSTSAATGRGIDNGAGTKIFVLSDGLEQTSTSDTAALSAHVSQYGRVFKREGTQQQAPNRLTSYSEPSSSHEVKCWFSGQLAIPGYELRIPMYREISRGFLSGSVEYEKTEVAIPRSSEAKRFHEKNNFRGLLCAGIAGVIGGVICLLLSVKPWLGIVAGALVGLVYGLASKDRLPEGWRRYRNWRRHAEVQALVQQGWSTQKPSG